MLFGSDGNQGVIETSQGSPVFSNSRLLINYGCGADVFVGNQNSGALVAKSRLGVRTEDFDLNGTTLSFRVNGFSLFDKAILIRDTMGEIALGPVNGYGNNFLTLNGASPKIRLQDAVAGNIDIQYSNQAGRLISDQGIMLFLDADNNHTDPDARLFRILMDDSHDSPQAKELFVVNASGRAYVNEIWILEPDINGRFPDYVFKDNYALKPLPEVEKFILEQGHLEGIPSEKEIKENQGLSLNDMLISLLKKQEETTLYLIQLNKEILSLKERNHDLEEQLKNSKK
jgi:hypothetical protein